MEMANLYRELGARIRSRRRALDFTQANLAARLGISRGALANIETGRQQVLLHQLYRFAAALDIDIQALMPAPAAVAQAAPAERLPLPEGLTSEQETQVARVFADGQRKAIVKRGNKP